MKALYNAALGDLGPDDLVIVRCQCCQHSEVLKPARFDALPRETGVMNLAPLLRCQACDEKGRVCPPSNRSCDQLLTLVY
jgi:hypothetical protein